MTVSINILEELITKFRTLPHSQSYEPTFMQIAGYPHLENVASNILQFYLQPANPHGFGTFLLETFLTFVSHEQAIDIQNIVVHREASTAERKRLDLVIETSDFVLGIENKIYHAVVNPFHQYRHFLDQISKGRTVYGLVLGLNTAGGSSNMHGFRPISYQMLFERVQERFGACLLSAKEPYITFFRDFVRSINDLTRGTTMNPTMLTYLREHRTDIEALLGEVITLREEMHHKAEQLAALLDTTVFPKPPKSGISEGSPHLFTIAWYDVEINSTIALRININLSPHGWRVNLHNSKGEQLHKRAALEAWLNKHNIPVKERYPTTTWRLGYGSDKLDYQADLTLIQQEVQEFFQLISHALATEQVVP